MTLVKKLLSLLKKKKYLSVIVVVVISAAIIFLVFNKNKNGISTIKISHSDFINKVSVSGKVVAGENVDLGFFQSGRVSSVRKKVGDSVSRGEVIASMENGDLSANLLQKQATLMREEAKLRSLNAGTRPEEIAIAEASLASAQTSLNQAQTSLLNYINDAYTKADDALRNKIDQFYENPNTQNPNILISLNNASLIADVNSLRYSVGNILNSWRDALSGAGLSNLDSLVLKTNSSLSSLKDFITKVSLVTNDSNSTYNGEAISATWKSDTSLARTNVDGAIASVATATTSYKNAQSEVVIKQNDLKLKQAGSTNEDIQIQEAVVKAAEADVESARAQLAKTLIVAPFSGEVTRADIKVGEIVSPGISVVSLMSAGIFQIESFVPEVSIAQIHLGDEAEVTLDAYGEDVKFGAQVVSIDPIETIRDGVSTYKIKLQFGGEDDRVRSGMTANVSIVTFAKINVIVVPGGVVYEKDGKTFVSVKKDGKVSEREITTGSVSSLGQLEVTSGLSDGDEVLLSPNIK